MSMPATLPEDLKRAIGVRLGQAYFCYEGQANPNTTIPVYGDVKIGGPFCTSVGDIWLVSFVVRVICTSTDPGFYALEKFAGEVMTQLKSSFTVAGVCSRVTRISGIDRGRVNTATGPRQYLVEAQHDFEF